MINNSSYLALLGNQVQPNLSSNNLLTGEGSSIADVTVAALSGSLEKSTGQNELQSDALQNLSDFITDNIDGPLAEALQGDVAALDTLQQDLSPGNQAVFSLLAGASEPGSVVDLLL